MRINSWTTSTGVFFLSAAVFVFTIFTNLDHGFWHDEVISLKFASPDFPLTESFRWWANFEPHPYTYYFALRIWFLIAGFGEATAKLFNPFLFILCAALSVWVWPAARRKEYLYYLSLNVTSIWGLFYLIEVRPYGAMLAVSLLAAACIFALQHFVENDGGGETNLWRPFDCLTGCVIILSALDSWGALLGSGIVVFALMKYPALRARIIDKWQIHAVLTMLAAVLALQYLNIYLIYDGLKSLGESLGNFSLDVSTWQLVSIMAGEFWDHLYVAPRSQYIAIAAFAIWVGALVLNRRFPLADIVIYLGPVAFAYGIVLIVHLSIGQAYYRHYSSLLLSPFVFMFLLSAACKARRLPPVAVVAICLFILANVGSIPFFDGFPDKPRHIEFVKEFKPQYR